MTLNLGVVEVPYTARKGSVTTVDVATWLENKYHVMEVFYEERRDDIAHDLAEAAADALEAVTRGGAPPPDPFAAAGDDIRRRFDDFITLRQIEGVGIPGVPTAAALRGTSARRKKARARGARRPSFFDTGTYVGAFRAWVEQT